MKRSEINQYINEALELFDKLHFKLPPWAYFSPQDWKTKGIEYHEVRENMLGWDVTDFGSGDFFATGLLLFTIRNGNLNLPGSRKTYAEKAMIVREKQLTPIHFHWDKMEDIINRGGGTLCIQLWKADQDEELSNEQFTVQTDGVTRIISGGDILRLEPGESITLEPYMYHTFWAEGGTVFTGEVSQVNDDNSDNRFYKPLGRFPTIEEDQPATFCLCNEYPEVEA